jgi:parallel beta-helix repeat protein
MRRHRSAGRKAFSPRLQALERREVPAVFIVDDTPRRGRDFDTIQEAVDAAAESKGDDTIRVYPGTYREQVTIAGEELDGLVLRSVNERRAVIAAPDTIGGEFALVQVSDAEDVVIDGFTINGRSKDLDFGVLVEEEASAVIRDNLITDIRRDPLSVDQTGIGVWVDTGAEASILDNTIVRYQKGGIVLLDEGTRAFISGNTIKGEGATDKIAQNGVQVAVGAEAVITDNRISRNIYTGDGADASGVIAFEAGRVVIDDNRLDDNETGVIVQNQTEPVFVTHNDIDDSRLDGISLDKATGVFIAGNRITDSDRDGIRLEDSSDNILFGNRSTDNDENGLTVTGESEDNLILFNVFVGNDGFDVEDDTQGDGTADTANTYFGNRIGNASPSGLESRGDRDKDDRDKDDDDDDDDDDGDDD